MGHKYGKLSYHDGKFYLVGEPILLEFAKRVFPGAITWRGKERGLSFSSSLREFSDLNWLMMRFPLEVECEDELNAARASAVSKWKKRANGDDLGRTTPPPSFLGKLYPYQESAVTFMVSNRRVLLGDGMGLGKTWSALGAAAQAKKAPVLIVCQTHIQLQWQRAIGALFDLPCSYQPDLLDCDFLVSAKKGAALATILKGRTPYSIPDTPFTIIHYGLLSWWDKALRERGYPIVIFDEVQELRHAGTLKYSAASLLSGDGEYVWGLSGTPVYGYGAEIWSVTNAVDFHCLGGREAFTREWCTGYGEKIVSKPKALNGYLVREGLLLRRRYDDVKMQLPKVVRRVQDLQQDDALYNELVGAAREKARCWGDARFTEKGKLSREIEGETRRAAGVAKADYVADFVIGLIEGGERPLVYAWHHAVHDILLKRLKEYLPASITGRQTQKQKDDALMRFVNGDAGVAILSLRSAAGLDGLQSRATCCVFAELDWSPAIHTQCETRIARIGVSDDVHEVPSYYCVSRSGFDEVIIDVLGIKKGQFVGLMGDEPEDADEQREAEQRASSRIKMLVEKLKQEKTNETNQTPIQEKNKGTGEGRVEGAEQGRSAIPVEAAQRGVPGPEELHPADDSGTV